LTAPVGVRSKDFTVGEKAAPLRQSMNGRRSA
jgi:hypothetical protein